MRKILVLTLTLLFIFTFASCNTTDTKTDTVDDENLVEYTLEELSMFDGKNDSKAYIAVNDYIYDVSDQWVNGEHNGYSAGTDVSDFINSAPHGDSVLDDLEKVGILRTE